MKQELIDALDNLRIAYAERREEQQKETDEFWDNLSYDDQCNAFHAVVQRIVQGDITDKGSYRWVIYDVFGFGPDMYSRGMDCGYMALHNSIMDDEEFERANSDKLQKEIEEDHW